jgi:hypothetical protein
MAVTRQYVHKHLFLLTIFILAFSLLLPGCGGGSAALVIDTKMLQEGNDSLEASLQPKESRELEDNRIGIFFCDLWYPQPEAFPDGVLDTSHILSEGVKRVRLAINHLDSTAAHWDIPENTIDPSHDEFITSLADNGITMTFVLSFWDKTYKADGGNIPSPRFKTEEEIQRYLDYVRLIVRHFKDRIEYYEIWNEPDIGGTLQWIEVEDYINLVQQTVPVILEEYPEAKIVVSGSYPGTPDGLDYLFAIISSDEIMPLVDVISWHAMYGTSPEHTNEYYYNYPSIVQEIRGVASTHGFTGEYVADELSWMTSGVPFPGQQPSYSETICAKYYARGIVMHLGMDVAVSQFYYVPPSGQPLQIINTIQNLCTIMAGAEPIGLSFEIKSAAENIQSYAFSLPDGDKLIALWTDGVATDDNPSIAATLTFLEFSTRKVTAIDVLNGIEQELITTIDGGKLVIRSLLVKDYPIILRLIH